jgi:ribosomal protein S18 acetylase RimI-like enzyme
VDVTEGGAGSRLVDEAARIWAEATAARDGDREVASLAEARPVIEQALGQSPRALLLVAQDGGEPAGFAVIGPLDGQDEATAQVSYVGVRPGMWGRGVGETLLREAARRLRGAGYRRAVLHVYTSNDRAVALYERLGWRPTGAPSAHPRSGKPEQRYELAL